MIEVKIPKDWIKEALKSRTLVNKYETNKAIKLLGYFTLLKTVTTTGVIHNCYDKTQKYYLADLLKLSRNGVINAINDLVKLDLASVHNGNLVLISWDKASTIISADPGNYVYFKYDLNSKAKINEYILALDIKLNKENQLKAVESKLKANPDYKEAIDAAIMEEEIDYNYLSKLLQEQINNYSSGTIKTELFKVRADLNRAVMTLKKDWSFKGVQSIAYWKRKLDEVGLITVVKVNSIISTANNRIYQLGNYAGGYNKLLNKPTWYLPDQITVIGA
jgi:hypothetical protein